MEVIPAIDIRGGKCVRLYQGDYDRETVFSEEPVAVASRWADLGVDRRCGESTGEGQSDDGWLFWVHVRLVLDNVGKVDGLGRVVWVTGL